MTELDLGDYVENTPPPFGHPMLKFFSFEPGYINLNHGAFGSLPTPVNRACKALGDRIEANPDKFMRLDYHRLLVSVREKVANLIGVPTDECVIVPNASAAAGIILRGFDWKAGDIIVGASTTYANVAKTLQYIHDMNPQTTSSIFPLALPVSHAEIIKGFRAHLRALPRLPPSELNPSPKIVCVMDSIISNPGILLPWKEMVKICEEEGVWSVVDAAHSIGQEVDLNLSEVKPDFWFSNCHKWLFAKRGCAVLHVPKRNQHLITSSFPTSNMYVSPGELSGTDWMAKSDENNDWVLRFNWTGTLDFVPYLSISAALEFRQWLGGEKKINDYCHDLAIRGGKRLVELLGTRLMDESENAEETLNMVNVELPLYDVPADKIAYVQDTLRDRLLKDFNTYAAHFPHNDRFWVRCSAQIWNEMSDFEYIGNAFSTVCKEIQETLRT